MYSLKEGINDGFLTPFKVRQFATTLDDYTYTPDDVVIDGEVVEGKRYVENDFNRAIIIREREEYRVKVFMDLINQQEKSLVFCATQDHALMVRDIINQVKTSKDPNYCVRVTANDGAAGEQFLREFQDNDKTIPTILTTSQKLSTGVDARNVRNIILMRPVNSMIEFKQIIGRGTRLFDGKDYFTIYDFVNAHHHFSDPEWDGEPADPAPATPKPAGGEGDPKPGSGGEDEPMQPRVKLKIKLAEGKERTIQHMSATSFLGPDGKPMSAQQFLESLYGTLPEFFKDEDQLREIWSDPTTRKQLLQWLADKGFDKGALAEMQKVIDAENSDLFDVLAYIAFAIRRHTRQERADKAKPEINIHYNSKQQAFLDFILSQYVKEGVDELDLEKLPALLKLRYGGAMEAQNHLGAPKEINGLFLSFQKYLYL